MGNYPEVGMASDAGMVKVSGSSTRDVLMKLWDAGFTPTQRTTLYDIVTSYEIDLREKLKFQSLSPLTEK